MRDTPSVRAALRCSSARISARRSGVIVRSLEPLLPFVTITYVTSQPSLTSLAMVPPAPNAESSGCAVTTIARWIFSDTFAASCCSGVREAGLHRGWPEIDATRLRSPGQPFDATRLRLPGQPFDAIPAPLAWSTLWCDPAPLARSTVWCDLALLARSTVRCDSGSARPLIPSMLVEPA